MERTNIRKRYWCFTLNNPIEDFTPQDDKNIRYAVWQFEIGEEGTVHIQGYIELLKERGLGYLRRLLPGAHWEIRMGTQQEAILYCKKAESRIDGPWEYGKKSGGQGSRNDLTTIKEMIDIGRDEKDIANEYFATWCRYYKSFREYSTITKPKDRQEPRVLAFVGPTGTGKSRKAMELGGADAYWKSPGNWWDGYDRQGTIILDDFYGWIQYAEFLRLLDRYPFQVQTKGGTRWMVADLIIITSNKLPGDWYSNCTFDPIRRRITEFRWFGAGESITFTDYDSLFQHARTH